MKKIGVFGSKESLKTIKEIAINGFAVLGYPVITFKPCHFKLPERGKFDWIFFGSKRGVKYFIEKVGKEFLNEMKIACVGKKTAQYLESEGIETDFVPENYSSENFLKDFVSNFPETKGILFPTSNLSDNSLKESFEKNGILFEKIIVYKTECNKVRLNENPDAFVFLSPSSFECFLKQFGKKPLENKVIVAIGPPTASKIEKKGFLCTYPEIYLPKKAIIKASEILSQEA